MSDRTYYSMSTKLDQFLEGALDGKIKSAINGRAFIGGLCMAIPLWGIETIIYAICLWGCYGKISEISGVPFRNNIGKNIVAGFVVNLLVTFVLGLVLDLIPFFGWIGSFFVGYLSIKMSAMGYVEALRQFHGNRAKSKVNYQQGFASLKVDSDNKQKPENTVPSNTYTNVNNNNYYN